jgi:hypothetical protein
MMLAPVDYGEWTLVLQNAISAAMVGIKLVLPFYWLAEES